ncbi:MAG: hypothetical protein JWO15_3524 [Sphingomonadales bacterium]|nr:hypothetical protein [Sphingomonadales bacterium]
MNIGNTLKTAKNVVTSKAGRQLLKTQKHSPTLLFGAGVIGVVATTVMASKATLKLEDILTVNERKNDEAKLLLSQTRSDYTTKDYTKDCAYLRVRLIKDLGRLYGPAFAVGVLSIGALGGSHVILTKRNAGIMAAYTALDKTYTEYIERVKEHVGEDKERELRFGSETREIAVDTDKGTKVETVTTADLTKAGASIYAKIFSEDTSRSWSPQPEYNLVFLKASQNWSNDMLQARGHVFLNDVYDNLGLERTPAGAQTGWVLNNKKGGDNFISFGVFDGENMEGFHDFFTGREGALLLDFNVDGVIWDLI